MRIVCLSDTHDFFQELCVPEGDLLLHGGDLSRRGTIAEVQASADWLRGLPHRHKVVIAGNHDFCLETDTSLLHGLTYLENEALEVEGLRIYGSPFSPASGKWAFQRERGPALRAEWARIPQGTQVLLTHGPPLGILDCLYNGTHIGCADLLERVRDVQPLLHLFGHIHEGHGCVFAGGTWFVNGSNCSLGYKLLQSPFVFDWRDGRMQPVEQPPMASLLRPGPPLWTELVQHYGPPREVRSLPTSEHRRELVLGQAFWVEVGGGVRFYPAGAADDVLDRGPGPHLRRWMLTFGVPFQREWAGRLAENDWQRYGEVPDLPV